MLKEIIATLNLNYLPFEIKATSVIDRLVRLRNSIAHGEGQPVDAVDYGTLHTEIILLLDEFKDQVEDAAHNNSHLLVP